MDKVEGWRREGNSNMYRKWFWDICCLIWGENRVGLRVEGGFFFVFFLLCSVFPFWNILLMKRFHAFDALKTHTTVKDLIYFKSWDLVTHSDKVSFFWLCYRVLNVRKLLCGWKHSLHGKQMELTLVRADGVELTTRNCTGLRGI